MDSSPDLSPFLLDLDLDLDLGSRNLDLDLDLKALDLDLDSDLEVLPASPFFKSFVLYLYLSRFGCPFRRSYLCSVFAQPGGTHDRAWSC